MNVPDLLQRRAQLSPHRLALVDADSGGARLTYADWNVQVNRTAHFLADLGLARGERLAVLAYNSVAYLDVWFALNKLGAVLQNLNWRLTAAELHALIVDAAPRVLLYDPELAETLTPLREMPLPEGMRFVSLGEPLSPGDVPFTLRERYPSQAPAAPPVGWDDPWVICYTGGTTGLPKGAVLSYQSMLANAVNTIVSWGLSPDDRAILNAPLFHTGGLNVFTLPLVYLGGASIVCRAFDVAQTFDLLTGGEATVFFGVPTMFIMMQNHPRWAQADFSHLKFVISGGAPCPQPVFERFWAKGVEFKTGYGLTEAGPNTFWLPAEQVKSKPGAVGYPLMHVELRIAKEDSRDAAPGEVGELLIRGPHLFSGYWNNPQATAEALRGGWLHTGDLAMRDADGCYTIMGRSKDMLISGGENVYPAEIESVLHGHPAVAETAVVGVPDPKWGEVPWAVVVLRPGAQIDEDALRAFCAERLARYKTPRHFLFWDALPKTGANKVDKRAIAARL
ncbi:MAG: long-chain fatty acid--CoA ligase [Anaerolineales bacterium]